MSSQQTVGSFIQSPNQYHAGIWSAAGLLDLGANSVANGTSGTQQVGVGLSNNYDSNQALLWNGTATSEVNLTPVGLAGIQEATAYATNGAKQVGEGDNNGGLSPHALLWSGTAASVVDLNPSEYAGSVAYSISPSGNQEVGQALVAFNNTNIQNAMLWTGTAASAVDLSPSKSTLSFAWATSGSQQVGYAQSATTFEPNAYLWSGTAASGVDLNPTSLAISQSYAYETNGTEQVGDGVGTETGGHRHALVWFGTADSAIDLGNLLPSTLTDSVAYYVDPTGNVFGIAKGTYNGVTGSFAVEWTAVPEPATTTIFLLPLMQFALRRRSIRNLSDRGFWVRSRSRV